jgi:hypothetical protein
MAFVLDNNQNHYFCLNRKRCFLSLLFFNCCLACIYYIHGQNLSQIERNVTSTKLVHNNLNRISYAIQLNKPIKFIRNILDSEYDQDDLVAFYNIVDKEFSLGLRCTRKTVQPQTIAKTAAISNNSNSTDGNRTNNTPTTTTTAVRYRQNSYLTRL